MHLGLNTQLAVISGGSADFFVFLCSNRAGYAVGSTYFVDVRMLRTV